MLVLAIVTGIGFIFAAIKLLDTTLSEVKLWQLGIMLVISTFGIWLTRLSAKIFVSNLHLRIDAGERAVMMKTYLALMREGNGLEENDRKLILQTLFRPSSTGIIKDDGPSGLLDVLSKSLSKAK